MMNLLGYAPTRAFGVPPRDELQHPAKGKKGQQQNETSQTLTRSALSLHQKTQSSVLGHRSLLEIATQSPPSKRKKGQNEIATPSPRQGNKDLDEIMTPSPVLGRRSLLEVAMQSPPKKGQTQSPMPSPVKLQKESHHQNMSESPARVKKSLDESPKQSPSRGKKSPARAKRSLQDKTPSPSKRRRCNAGQPIEIVEYSPEEFAVLPGLFFGLEFVLRLLSARNLKAYHSVVRADVEAITGRDMDDSRLAGVLSLVGPGMIDVRWVGIGRNAKMELLQRGEDGKERSPTVDEQPKRKAAFNAALAVAVENGVIHRSALPPRPSSGRESEVTKQIGMPNLPEPANADRPAVKNASASKRREALLKRVRAREAAVDSVETKEYEDLRRRMIVFDNAMYAHSILLSFFARGEGKHSAASEAETIQAMISATSSVQCRRTLNRPAAVEAVKLLATRAVMWFSVDAGVHNPDAKYFRRLLKGSSALALDALKNERQDLDDQLRAVCEFAKRREQQIRSQQLIDDAAEEATEAPVAMDECSSEPTAVNNASVGVPKEDAGKCVLEPPAPIEIGDIVEIFGLQSKAGQELNGCRGEVTAHVDGDRLKVRFANSPPANVKPGNLRKVDSKAEAATSDVPATNMVEMTPRGRRLRKKTQPLVCNPQWLSFWKFE